MKIHIVKKGDTLFELANKHHVDLNEVIAMNPHIADPNMLAIGTKVKLPSKPKHVEPPATAYAYKHIVQQGDTLWKLGKAWDVPLSAMIQANPQLKNPNVLMTGEVVYVPKASHAHTGMHGHAGTHMHTGTHAHMGSMPSTEPSPAQPWTSVENPQSAMPMPEQPSVPAPAPVVSAPAPQPPSPTSPVFYPPMPTELEPITEPGSQPGVIGLNEPYEQPAVHPFQHIHIQATEVFAQPQGELPEGSDFPAFPPHPQAPWGHMEPPFASDPQQQHTFPMHQGGCGCGDVPAGDPQDWSAFPTGSPYGVPGGMPQDFPSGMGPWEGFMPGMPPAPGFYPPHTGLEAPYDMHPFPMVPGMPWHGYQPDMAPLGMPYPGIHAQTPYESPMIPQAHTHQLEEIKDTEETVEIDIRSGKKAARMSGSSARKAKADRASTLQAFLKTQQALERQEARPNLPWINL